MKHAASTAAEYLAVIPEHHRAAPKAVHAVVNTHLPKGYAEGIGWGMIVWSVPLKAHVEAAKQARSKKK
jgi:hypothetical protein